MTTEPIPRCDIKIKVQPPPVEELKLPTHWGCIQLSFWFKMPQCISCRTSTACICCRTTNMWGLTQDLDDSTMNHMTNSCFSIKRCQEEGPLKAIWFDGFHHCVNCFIFESGGDYDCRMPYTFFKCSTQQCCVDVRCALPFDEDMPYGWSCCGHWCKEPQTMATGWDPTKLFDCHKDCD